MAEANESPADKRETKERELLVEPPVSERVKGKLEEDPDRECDLASVPVFDTLEVAEATELVEATLRDEWVEAEAWEPDEPFELLEPLDLDFFSVDELLPIALLYMKSEERKSKWR